MKKIKFILGFIATVSAVVGVGALMGSLMCIMPNVYGKIFLGALGVLLAAAIIWTAVSRPEDW